VIDLRDYEATGAWRIVRVGAVAPDDVAAALGAQFHFHPDSYAEMIRAELPGYEELQAQAAAAGGAGLRRILELGTGTGETARRLLDRHPGATLVGLDESREMLEVARDGLDARADLRVGRIEDRLPEGPFDLVASALCVHHLEGTAKAYRAGFRVAEVPITLGVRKSGYSKMAYTRSFWLGYARLVLRLWLNRRVVDSPVRTLYAEVENTQSRRTAV